MESIVKDLLEELYILEPNLRKQEKKLENIISLMIRNVPKSEMNNEFKKELRKQILAKIHSKKENRFSLFFPVFASISIFVLLGIFSWKNIYNTQLENISTSRISFVSHVEQRSPNSFGSSIKTISRNNLSIEGGRTMGMMPSTAKISGDMAMPAYEGVTYQYSYSGTLPKIESDTLLVYKRNPVAFTSQDTTSFIRNLHIDGLDTTAFQNALVSNINISEDREFGYNIGIDFTAGSVNFYQNYPKWPQMKCDKNGCETLPKLTEKDIPNNESLIALTDTFFTKYGINRSIYGLPHVDSAWRTMYARSIEEGVEGLIPDMYTVTYPIILDGKNLYEEFGGYKGLVFTVDVRNMRIASVSGLEKYNLESSEYPIIQDSEILGKMISSGGRHIIGDMNTPSGKIIPITLRDPIIGYVRISGEWKDGISSDFFVPAYIFTIENKLIDTYISDTVIIPIVEGFSSIENTMPTDMPVMMK